MVEETKETGFNVDIGGLHGWTFIEEAKRHPEQQFVVIDPRAQPPPTLSKEKLPPNLIYIKGQVEKPTKEKDFGFGIPLKDASTDRVLIEQVFDQVKAYLWKPLFAEASRILKMGGQLKIIDLIRNKNEIMWSLPAYGFSEIKARPLRKEEGSKITKEFAENRKLFSSPICITAKKIQSLEVVKKRRRK